MAPLLRDPVVVLSSRCPSVTNQGARHTSKLPFGRDWHSGCRVWHPVSVAATQEISLGHLAVMASDTHVHGPRGTGTRERQFFGAVPQSAGRAQTAVFLGERPVCLSLNFCLRARLATSMRRLRWSILPVCPRKKHVHLSGTPIFVATAQQTL